uniref:endothelin-converting enzyme-like 1 n=1 Tax=Myxine glutinosa TaxID=7769 RepID=UPI00358F9EFE
MALLVVCALALGLCGVLGSVLLLGRLAGTKHSFFPTGGSGDRTPRFGQAARFLRLNVNASADPCQDFYAFACGGWLARHRMPEDRQSFGLVSVIELENERKLRALLTEGQRSGRATSFAEEKARKFYRSCTDTAELDRRAGEPLLDEVRTLGGWDVLGFWNPEQWDMNELLFRAHGVYNVPVFLSLIVDVDGENSSRNVIRIDQGGLTLPEWSLYLWQDRDSLKVIKAYKTLMRKLSTLLGARRPGHKLAHVFELEKKLAKAMSDSRRTHGDGNSRPDGISIEALQTITPVINWKLLLEKMTQQEMQDEDLIEVLAPEYLQKVSTIIAGTPARTLQSYMMWRLVVTLSVHLSAEFRTALHEFRHHLNGVVEPKKWRHFCLEHTNDHFGLALGSLFIRQNFPGSSKQRVQQMVEDIKYTFSQRLDYLDWMDRQTREAARDKLQYMVDMIGYPDFLLHTEDVDKEYGFEVNEKTYFRNVLNSIAHKLKISVRRNRRSSKHSSWLLPPQSLNAYYLPTKNHMVFPAGILQPTLFDPNFPQSMNYGAIGTIIGHELTHGYDDWGGQYDRHGNLAQWWTEESYTHFLRKANCVVNLFANFSINEHHVNGQLTLGENIADMGGLKLAYYAYRKWVMEHGTEFPLPGLPYTHEQLFFLAFAQNWCMKKRPQALLMQLLTDKHSPEMYRVLGSVSQFTEFSRAFQCPNGCPMNPNRKCSIW